MAVQGGLRPGGEGENTDFTARAGPRAYTSGWQLLATTLDGRFLAVCVRPRESIRFSLSPVVTSAIVDRRPPPSRAQKGHCTRENLAFWLRDAPAIGSG